MKANEEELIRVAIHADEHESTLDEVVRVVHEIERFRSEINALQLEIESLHREQT